MAIHRASIHGREARKFLDEARYILASAISAKESEIIFTSGGTEADNMAIFGTAYAREIRRQTYYYDTNRAPCSPSCM